MWFIRLRKKLFEFIKFTMSANKRKCLILGTPAHKNLGDHAIVYAQYKFIMDNYKDCSILEMSRLEYETYKKVVKLFTSKNTLIVVDGGGNLGTLWKAEDDCIRDIVERFRRNPVIVFPQTAYYEDSESGRSLFEKTVKLIDSADNLLFMFRDKKSFDMFGDRVDSDRILLCPDIVTYTDDACSAENVTVTKKAGICFRDDKENIMDEKLREKITKVIESAGFETTLISTISPVNVHADERNETLRSKWEEFGQCSLIITDRLHGMIFSAVTGTNCIAFDNISHKVCGGYEWLEKLDYVKYCDNYNDFENAFQGFSFDKKNEYRRELVIGNHFARITEFIESLER